MTEKMGFQTFPTVGQQRPEKLDRRWLKDGCVWQQAMMSMQSGDDDGPQQQMPGGIHQQDMAELSGICRPEPPAWTRSGLAPTASV